MSNTPPVKADFSDFFTRKGANDGVRVDLSLPTGETTDQWLQIRGRDSDVFREAEAEMNRDVFALAAIEDKMVQKAGLKDLKLRLTASLIMAWSFNQDCTIDNIVAFFKEAPQIADQVDRVGARRALFFAKKESSLPDSLSTSSDSTKPPTVEPHSPPAPV
jgi:hypothetical protein